MDIVSPPFPDTQYEFGAFNERLVVERTVQELLKSFIEDGKMPEKATIAIGVEKEWIETASTSMIELPWSEIPRLEWTPGAKGQSVRFFGGRHRMKTCLKWREKLEGERTTVRDKLEKVKKSGSRSSSQEEQTVMEASLSALDAAILDAQLWVCRVYILCESICSL